jgi:hypothetical protein
MIGIVKLAVVPMRFEPFEQSEMVSQLLFGEVVEITQTTGNWFYACNRSDNYCAWVDRKMIQLVNDVDLIDSDPHILSQPITKFSAKNTNFNLYLPAGSHLHHFCENKITINGIDFFEDATIINEFKNNSHENLVDLACLFLNAPYLWGGKTIMGIDCSGFVQLLFSIFKFQLSRDASQQVEHGSVIDFLNEAKVGDLAFFENDDAKIIHVGILMNSEKIIHASGCVRIDNIDNYGILNSETGVYSHKLRVIKRLIY